MGAAGRLDGVFSEAGDGTLKFHPAEQPGDEDIASLLCSIRHRVLRHLGRRGLLDDDRGDTDSFSDEAPLLADCYASSIQHRQTLGDQRGSPLERLGRDRDAVWVEQRGRLQAHLDGFDLHANVSIAAQHLEGRLPLEKLLRYGARPPIAHDRLSVLPDGRIALRLKTSWSDGSTHVLYQPVDLIAKLAALVPRPHKNLVLYHGVLAANARWRARVVCYARDTTGHSGQLSKLPDEVQPVAPRHKRRQWAELMRRAFGYQLLCCPDCGGKMTLIACVLERAAIRRILAHVGLATEPPLAVSARAPPRCEPLFDYGA